MNYRSIYLSYSYFVIINQQWFWLGLIIIIWQSCDNCDSRSCGCGWFVCARASHYECPQQSASAFLTCSHSQGSFSAWWKGKNSASLERRQIFAVSSTNTARETLCKTCEEIERSVASQGIIHIDDHHGLTAEVSSNIGSKNTFSYLSLICRHSYK